MPNFQVRDWPTAILHLDGDSFFASVTQAVRPELRGKPLVTGSERGVATAVSPEAKKLGITRTTPIYEVKRRFPQVIITHSDYELYHLFSQKIFTIMRRYSPTVEEYSVDEGFADIKGLRRPLHMTYQEIAANLKKEVESSLGISVSVGVSLTKSLAKIASSYGKPSGLTLIPGKSIHIYLAQVPIGDVWGIGENTSAYLKKIGIYTALDLASKSEEFITQRLTKPYFEIWQELRGEGIYKINMQHKNSYKSITRSHTFPKTSDPNLLWAHLTGHIEDAFEEARLMNYHVGKVSIYLKTQGFQYHHKEIKLLTKVNYPHSIKHELKQAFFTIYKKSLPYRTTGCTISDLEEIETVQESLFGEPIESEKIKKVYPLLEKGKIHFASSLYDRTHKIKEKKPTHFSIPTLSVTDI